MTKLTSGTGCLMFASVVVMYGCSKSSSGSNNTAHVPEAIFTTDLSQSPYYGDTILYTQETALVSPVNVLGAGRFVSWPEGLTIDARSGVIDVSKSEPGSRYNVGFIDDRTKDTSFSQVVIAGASYPDGIYYADAQETTLQPYYNAGASDLSGKSARFGEAARTGSYAANTIDADGSNAASAVNANGNNAANTVNADGSLNANPATGAIDLKAALRNGLFGANPQNGATKEVAVYFRLNDGSRMSLQKTTLTFHYYEALSDVPLELVNRFGVGTHTAVVKTMGGPTAVTGGTTTPAVVKKAAPAPVAPRPPQIVIVNKGH